VLDYSISVIDYRPAHFVFVVPAQGTGHNTISVSVDVDNRTSFDF
jgi:hypothetical protein